MYFEKYGYLEEITPEDYYSGDWTHVENVRDKDGEMWSICFSESLQECRYGAY